MRRVCALALAALGLLPFPAAAQGGLAIALHASGFVSGEYAGLDRSRRADPAWVQHTLTRLWAIPKPRGRKSAVGNSGNAVGFTILHLDLLRQQGCDEAQGYLFGRPLPEAQFREMLGGAAAALAAKE